MEIGNHVGDRDLDDAGDRARSCSTAREVGAPVFVHPWDMPGGPRLDRWMARWLTGMPAETHLSMLAMILGGVFDRVPETLRICFAHGGGSFAVLARAGPTTPGTGAATWCAARRRNPPSHYLDRFFVDTVVFEPAALRLLVDTMGEDRVLLGSDYPYPLGERPVGAGGPQGRLPDRGPAGQAAVGNALRFLGGRG